MVGAAKLGGEVRAENSFLHLLTEAESTDAALSASTLRPTPLPKTTTSHGSNSKPFTILANFTEDVEQTSESNDVDSGEEGTVSIADYNKVVERLELLEESWEVHQESLDKAAADKKKKPAYKLNGRIHLDNWWFSDGDAGVNFLETGDPLLDPQDRWDFRRIRLTWTGQVPNNMVYRVMIDFNNPQTPEIKTSTSASTICPPIKRC